MKKLCINCKFHHTQLNIPESPFKHLCYASRKSEPNYVVGTDIWFELCYKINTDGKCEKFERKA